MSTSATTTTTAMSDKQRRIARFLEENVTTQTYFKSRLIGDELDMSAKEVGANMRAVREASGLSIEKWGYSSGTTWKVTA